MKFPIEIGLLFSYLSVEDCEQNAHYARSQFSRQLDWEKILSVAQHNEITTLFYHNLKKTHREDLIPPKVRQELEKSYSNIGLQNLRFFGELKKILRLFETYGIDQDIITPGVT